MAEYNITVDDTDHTAIEYYPPYCDGSGGSSHDSDGTITSCESHNNSPGAIFRFTGVAVYMLMARRNDTENMFLSLDGQSRVLLDISSRTGVSLDAEVVWSATNLSNQRHTLDLFPLVYASSFGHVKVDAFIYTARLGEPGPIISQGSNTTSSKPTFTPIPSQEPSSSRTSTGVIAAGVAGGGAIMLAMLAFILWRRRKMKKKSLQNEEGSTYSGSDKDFMPVRRSSPTLSSQPTDPMEVLRRELPESVFPLPISQYTIIARRELPDLAPAVPSSQISDPRRSPSLSSLPIAIRELPDLTSPVPSSQTSHPRMVVASPTNLFNDCGSNGGVTEGTCQPRISPTQTIGADHDEPISYIQRTTSESNSREKGKTRL